MRKIKILFWLILPVISALEMLAAWKVPGFSDFYVKHIFPVFQETFGRINGLFVFSLGEILIYAAVIYVVLTVLLLLVRFVKLCEGKDSLKKLARGNFKVFLKILILVALVQVQNCFVLYHTTPLYENTSYSEYQPNREDLIELREILMKQANELSVTFERDADGGIVYDADLGSIARIAMQGLGEEAAMRIESDSFGPIDERLSQLCGYYPAPKPFFKSDFFSQQKICGYYWPFTLEANYNDLMYIANIPDTMCHELSHLKGFIFEDEASFLAYLGCMYSKDPLFIYSATINALDYISPEVKRELALEPERRAELTKPNELVISDDIFLTAKAWEEVEKDALFKTEKVSEASNAFLDTNLTLNGVEDGVISYSRMVNLLLKYYFGGEN